MRGPSNDLFCYDIFFRMEHFFQKRQKKMKKKENPEDLNEEQKLCCKWMQTIKRLANKKYGKAKRKTKRNGRENWMKTMIVMMMTRMVNKAFSHRNAVSFSLNFILLWCDRVRHRYDNQRAAMHSTRLLFSMPICYVCLCVCELFVKLIANFKDRVLFDLIFI